MTSLFARALAECSPETLFTEHEKGRAVGCTTLEEWIDRRTGEIIKQLIRDAAPAALREYRKVHT